MLIYSAWLTKIELHTHGLRRIVLQLDSNAGRFEFQAGQYLSVAHPNGTQIPLSIASAPWQLPQIELLYRTDGVSEPAVAFDQLLSQNTTLELTGPFGDVTLSSLRQQPKLRLIAAGTGIAQVLSVVSQLDHLHAQDPQRYPRPATQVLWVNRIALAATDTMLKKFSWAEVQHCRSDSLPEHLRADVLVNPQAFNLIAGTPEFVYAVQDELLALECPLAQMAADAFDYAPR